MIGRLLCALGLHAWQYLTTADASAHARAAGSPSACGAPATRTTTEHGGRPGEQTPPADRSHDPAPAETRAHALAAAAAAEQHEISPTPAAPAARRPPARSSSPRLDDASDAPGSARTVEEP